MDKPNMKLECIQLQSKLFKPYCKLGLFAKITNFQPFAKNNQTKIIEMTT